MITLEEFKKLCADEIKNLSEQEIEVFYTASIRFFDILFNKWKKEKLSQGKA